MMNLYELQNNFQIAIFPSINDISDFIAFENDLGQKHGLQVYRNNIFFSLAKALKTTYPVVHRLVGDEYFSALAKAYIQQEPSTSENLADYGQHFPQFLLSFIPAKSYPYLSEVAQLEWAYHEVFHAEEPCPLDLNKFKTIPETAHFKIKFILAPTCRFFAFTFPVLKIWQMCQNENQDEQVDIDQPGENILVARRQLKITFEKITAGEFAFLSAFKQKNDFRNACAQAWQIEPEFDVSTCLQQHLLKGTIVDFKY